MALLLRNPAGLLVVCSFALAQPAERIRDNSFLLEEAYNQERSVVQHIQTFQYMRDHTWSYAFVQEWPLPDERNQLSYTIPVLRGDGPARPALGDVALNYRRQVLDRETLYVAPRLSLLLPTGDYRKGLGAGGFGIQANLPVSVELSRRWVTHWNAGLTAIPHARAPGGLRAGTAGFNLGASAICNVFRNTDVLVENLWLSNQSVLENGSTARSNATFVSPGLRFAINHSSGLQVVTGVAAPIGVGPSRGDRGLLLYLSFEHPFGRRSR